MRIERHQRALIRVAVALAVAGSLLVPDPSNARPTQEADPASAEGGADHTAQIDIEVDPLRADDADIEAAFGDIRDNVEAQRASLDVAEVAVTNAQTALLAAQAAVDATQAEIDGLVAQSDEVVVQAFMAPPAENAIEAMSSENAGDATVKQIVLDMQATSDAGVLEQLDAAQDRMQEQQETEQAAADAADLAVGDAELALSDLQDAVSQQTAFANEVESRLERDLAEIESLRESDPELAARLEEQALALAAQIAESRRLAEEEDALEDAGVAPADPNVPTGPITITVEGGLAIVSCPDGLGSIDVAGVIARDLQGLLNLAAEQGLPLCGNGWRDVEEQIALRRSNCGTSNYSIYYAPASSCSPPTAPPGSSMHEQGLAIDFTCGSSGTVRWGDQCHDFLRANAADYGLYPLGGEAWHWSTNGQ